MHVLVISGTDWWNFYQSLVHVFLELVDIHDKLAIGWTITQRDGWKELTKDLSESGVELYLTMEELFLFDGMNADIFLQIWMHPNW